MNGVHDHRPFFREVSSQMPKLTDVEQKVLDRYTQGAFIMNKELRQSAERARKHSGIIIPTPEDVDRHMRDKDTKSMVRDLDDLIQQKGITLVRPFTTYRGVINPEEADSYYRGIISGRQHGFLSTSLSPRAAASLPTSEVLGKHDWIPRYPKLLKISVKPGTRFIPNPQQSNSRFYGENELLFPRGMHLDTEESPSSHLRFFTRDRHSGFETTTHRMPVYRSRISHRGHS